MKKVFLEKLPSANNKISWEKSIGEYVPFIYDDISGSIEIIEYNKNKQLLTIKYNKDTLKISTANFKKCCIGRILKKYTNEFKYEIGESIKDDKRDLIITDKEYRVRTHTNGKSNINEKWYKYTCNKCGWTEGWIEENRLKRGSGCACCSGKTVTSLNSILATDKWMTDLGVSEEDAKKYTSQSSRKIEVICPNCKRKKQIIIYNIYKHKSICCSCGDGTSYPEKILTNVLDQLEVEFITQLNKSTFKWCENKRYDFYIPKCNIIIEVHGLQHYEKSNRGKSLDEIIENDEIKKEGALKNGIEHYVVIDCRYSDLNFIKNNILKSELSNIFDLSNIDWLKCEEFALKNIVKEVCDYWNNTGTTSRDIGKIFKKSRTVINAYLKKGAKLGWCSYDAKEEMKRGASIRKDKNKKIVEVLKDKESLGIFSSIVELEKQSEELFGVKLIGSKISQVATGKSKSYKGFVFKYIIS